ncbi:hypothetical protein VTH06DRAFT_1795 [Thermothelomyces fergusii]
MGSQLIIDANLPIRVSETHHSNKPPPEDLHRYWRSHQHDGYLERYWPDGDNHDEWIRNIRRILSRQFPDLANADIRYFSNGTFNRLYSITKPTWDKTYLFRVSIPVEPFFKTESEVATMEYVRRHTTMPIPRAVAFSSSDDNELGYEWILMEMMPGEPLRKLWSAMPEGARVAVFAELAVHVKQLVALRFSKFGNVYFADVADRVLPHDVSLAGRGGGDADTGIDKDIGPGRQFVIGRIVAQDFFFDKRVYYPGPRGPFLTTRQLVDMRVELLGRRLRHLSPVEGEAWYCENDRELERNKERVYELFDQLKALVPRLVPPENGPEDRGVLWHDDLSEHNLLLDPVTFKLTGVLDWESVSIAYHGIVGPLYDDSSPETQQRVRNKRGIAKQLEIDSFQHRPWWTAEWMAENGFLGVHGKSADMINKIGAVAQDDRTKGVDALNKTDASEDDDVVSVTKWQSQS